MIALCPRQASWFDGPNIFLKGGVIMVTILVIILLLASIGAHAVANAIQRKADHPNQLSPAYALLSRIRLSSLSGVLASAEQVIQHIFSTYSEPNLAPEEFQSRAAKREDPLREFSRICGAELEAIQKP